MTAADADVIVMGADHDRFSRPSWIAAAEHAHDVPDGPAVDREVFGVPHARAGQNTRARHEIAIDLAREQLLIRRKIDNVKAAAPQGSRFSM